MLHLREFFFYILYWKRIDLMEIFSPTVIDVYNEWSGPCKCMVSIFKKAKLDLGDKLYKPAIVSWYSTLYVLNIEN